MLRNLRALLATGLLLAPAALAAGDVYTLQRALAELHDSAVLHKPPDPPRRALRLSSIDPNGGAFDQGQFLRREGVEHVLLDVEGPGVVTRLWTSQPAGFLRFYWDGAEAPQLAIPWSEIADGTFPPLVPPFVQTGQGGCTVQFPLTFEKGLRITLSSQLWIPWSVDYSIFAPDQAVESWPAAMSARGENLQRSLAELQRVVNVWDDPAQWGVVGDLSATAPQSIHAGSRELVYTAEGNRLVTEVRFLSSAEQPLPAELHFTAAGQSTPWRALCGLWSGTGEFASFLQGSTATASYFRVPFLLEDGATIRLHWQGDSEGEVVGALEVRSVSIDEPTAATPRLFLSAFSSEVGAGKGLSSDPITSNGRLLLVGLHAQATINSEFMESDLFFSVDGKFSHGFTRFEDFAGAGTYFPGGVFATPFASVTKWSDDFLELATNNATGLVGVPFSRSLQLNAEGGTADTAPPTRYDVVLAGQLFGDAVEASAVSIQEPATTHAEIGRRITTGVDGSGMPIFVEKLPPVAAMARPFQAWLDEESGVSGTLDLQINTDGLDRVEVRLDLPFGWTGTLSGAGVEKEVFDIGWPPMELYGPTVGEQQFTWSANPPQVLHGGSHLVQLRVEAFFSGGDVATIRHPVTIHAVPRGAPAIEFAASDINLNNGIARLDLPDGFEGLPGDVLAVQARASDPAAWREVLARLRFDPPGPARNDRGMPEEVIPLLPENATAVARLPIDAEPHWAAFAVGNTASWIGNPRSAAFDIPALSGEGTVEVLAARLYRRPTAPPVTGWMKRVPYWEMPEGTFHMPEGKLLLSGNDLVERIEIVSSTPADRLNPHFREAGFLENVEAGPLTWRLADPPRREGGMRPSVSYEFQARHIGSRLMIRDERIAGERFFGFELGFGPMCGTVAIRDCEGRPAAVVDTWMNRPVSLPQWVWVALERPSRDGFIYLESLGPAPGSLEQRIVLQKFLITGNLDE